jgi:hypothetical protein
MTIIIPISIFLLFLLIIEILIKKKKKSFKNDLQEKIHIADKQSKLLKQNKIKSMAQIKKFEDIYK